MPRYIAFLRGINVGGHRVKMDRLGGLFEDLGFTDVETFIASGNVIFTSSSRAVDALKGKIERHLEGELGYEVATFIRTPAELKAVCAVGGTFVESEADASSSIYVMFFHSQAGKELKARINVLGSEMDEFTFSGRELFWRVRGKISESPLFGTGIEKALRGAPNTSRNITTLRKLVAKTA